MRLSRKQRQEVWNKSGGLCWYCGCSLPEKGWHADHFHPVLRNCGSSFRPERHTVENIVPACAPCNLYKGGNSIEWFRRLIQESVTKLRRYQVNFRNAEKFGLVSAEEKPVVFWFEKSTSR